MSLLEEEEEWEDGYILVQGIGESIKTTLRSELEILYMMMMKRDTILILHIYFCIPFISLERDTHTVRNSGSSL